ncbi:MAG: hypothetical protein ACI9KE_003828 [Polyangiales bacterium]|jgi:hypothetical protein
MRNLLILIPLSLCACLPTGTGNPLQDASPGQDGGAASDTGPGFDASPRADSGPGADAALSDAGAASDAAAGADGFAPDVGTCTDSGPSRCGTTGEATCECLAGESVTLGEGRPLLVADHEELDGRVTLVRRRQAEADGTVIEAIVVAGGVVESTTELATNVQDAAASNGDAISVAVRIGEGEILHFEVGVETGVSAPAVSYTHPRGVGAFDVARNGTTTALAFSSAVSDDLLDGRSVSVVRFEGGVFNAEIAEHMGGVNIRALSIAALEETWLLAVATDDSVFTLLLDAAGAAMGASQEVAAIGFVSRLDLTATDDGFLLAHDGVAPAVYFLDAGGASVAQQPVVGRVLALEWLASGAGLGFAMMLRSDTLSCATSDSPLVFERFRAGFRPLHEPVRVGSADYAAAVTLVDGSPWVANSTGTALNFVNACLDED